MTESAKAQVRRDDAAELRIGDVVLHGSPEDVQRADWTIEHLKGKTRKPQRSGVDLTAPLPLGYAAACAKAIELREFNPEIYTWNTVAETLRRYHGFDRGGDWYREELRGQVASRARGGSFTRRAA